MPRVIGLWFWLSRFLLGRPMCRATAPASRRPGASAPGACWFGVSVSPAGLRGRGSRTGSRGTVRHHRRSHLPPPLPRTGRPAARRRPRAWWCSAASAARMPPRSAPMLKAMAIAAALACLAPAVSRAAETIEVGAVGSANSVVWPHYIAEAMLHAAQGLNIDLFYSQSGSAMQQALTSGSTQMGIAAGIADPMNAFASGAGIAIVRIDGPWTGPYAVMAKKRVPRDHAICSATSSRSTGSRARP